MDKKTFLFLNIDGDFLCIHQRVVDEGYDAYSWYRSDSDSPGKDKTGKNMIEVVDDYFDVINSFKNHKQDLIICYDDNSYGDSASYLQFEGWNVIGSSSLSDQLEHNRGQGADIAEKIGLKIPPSVKFTDFDEAVAYVRKLQAKKVQAKFVFKGDGAAMAGNSKTYLAQSLDDMIHYLEFLRKDQEKNGYRLDQFELNLIIDGQEMDCAMWFNGEKMLPVMPVTFEQKRIHGLGQAEGCLGQVVYYADPRKEPYFKKYITKLPEHIQGSPACEWAINNIVANRDRAPYFLEFTPRFGWDSTIGEMAILQEYNRSIAEFLIMTATKQEFPKGYFPYYKYSASVRLYSGGVGSRNESVCGKPIYWKPEQAKNFWWYNIKQTSNGVYEVTDNPIGVASAVADSPAEAVAKVYDLLKKENENIVTPDIFYSETIGEGVPAEISKLQSWGILGKKEA